MQRTNPPKKNTAQCSMGSGYFKLVVQWSSWPWAGVNTVLKENGQHATVLVILGACLSTPGASPIARTAGTGRDLRLL